MEVNSNAPTDVIRKQVEFYFGDSNIHKDRFMKQKIQEDPEGCNTLYLILPYPFRC
jgi:lupus La protein